VASDAFDLRPSSLRLNGDRATLSDLAIWLAGELDLALSARGSVATDIRYAWDYYEQNRIRGSNAPWDGAADLTSPLAAEYVDAIHARLMQTIFVDPVWTVEGWGDSATRAPLVEEFHQRAQEDERFQNYADEWVMRGLVEGVGILEVSEAFDVMRERQRRRVKIQTNPETGAAIFGEDQQPILQRDEQQNYLDAETPDEPSAEVEVDAWVPVRLGPQYDVVPYLDFLLLPHHARDRSQVWGYAKRFWRRVPELQARAKLGVYDKKAVDALGTENERQTLTEEAPANPAVVSQDGMTAQKELWELQLLADLDGDGERWWRVTLSKEKREILRIKADDRTTRYIRWMPFPRPGTADRGYSIISNKLITVIEEDTARRNLTADRMALVAGSPMLRLQGALWDPFEQPFGPRSVIDVRQMDEVRPMQGIADVPGSVMAWRGHIREDADRLIGQNDVSLGVGTADAQKPTATQVTATASYAEVRTNVLIKRLQEPMEELAQARHAIWKRTLKQQRSGQTPSRAVVIGKDNPGIESSGFAEDGRVTAEMLDGVFWFKPRGSVETADLGRQAQNYNAFLMVAANLMKVNPAIAQVLSTVPAAKALLEQAIRVNRFPDKQALLGTESHSVFDAIQQEQALQQQQRAAMADPRMQLLMAASGGAMPGMSGPPQGPPQGDVNG
jgi:hypothetical protein